MEITNDILTAAQIGDRVAEAHPLVVHIEAGAFVVVEKNDGRGTVLFATEKAHILQAFMASWRQSYIHEHDDAASPPPCMSDAPLPRPTSNNTKTRRAALAK